MNITVNQLKDGLQVSHRKENKFWKSSILVAYSKKQFSEPITVRWYFAGSTAYCCIWGNIKGQHFSGSGSAGGYGYEKSSAALSSALQSAGFNVNGLSASGGNNTAMEILAKLNGSKIFTIVNAHA